MRISDWSSEVCSSDLEAGVGHLGIEPHIAVEPVRIRLSFEIGEDFGLPREHPRPARVGREAVAVEMARNIARAAGIGVVAPGAAAAVALFEDQDRKSVVEGKSGSVRVTLGGRRIIKKKKK